MKIRMFHVGDGDCVLLSSGGKNILVDGGRKGAFQDNARAELAQLPQLDVVCVSHIDDDHISGILGMIEDEVEHRVHAFELESDLNSRPPRVPKPTKIKEIWHNGLFELVGDELEPEVAEVLASSARTLGAASAANVVRYAENLQNLASGEKSSMELSRRISSSQLDIKRNRPRNKLMKRRGRRSRLRVSPFTIRVLGPSDDDLDGLREVWKKWLKKNKKALKDLQAEMLEDEEDLGLFEAGAPAPVSIGSALGDGASGVTEPNLASLMLWVEDGSNEILLTGDGVSDEILAGLRHFRKLRNGQAHVHALKVQHHGAEANVTQEFVDAVTADNYLFCGNGAHHNPELSVVDAFFFARVDHLDEQGDAVQARGPDRPFKFWFSSAENTPGLTDTRKEYMKGMKERVEELKRDFDSNDRFTFEFLRKGSVEIP